MQNIVSTLVTAICGAMIAVAAVIVVIPRPSITAFLSTHGWRVVAQKTVGVIHK